MGLTNGGDLLVCGPARGNDFDASMHKITMNDFLVRPARWIPANDYEPGQTEGGLWGLSTRKKYELMCEKFNLTYEDFASEATMPNAKRTMIKNYFVNYLQELYDKGNSRAGGRRTCHVVHGGIMENSRGTTLDSGTIMVEQCKSDNYETKYSIFFNKRVHLFGRGLL